MQNARLPKALDNLIRGTDDADLVVGLRRRDPEAMGLLYDRYGKLAHSLAFKILGDGPAAESAVAEAAMKCWNRISSFHETRGGALGTWLLLTTYAAAIAHRTGKAQDWSTQTGPLEQASVYRGWSKELDGDHVRALYSALLRLDPQQREVLDSAIFQALNPAELAILAGCSRLELEHLISDALAELAAAE